MLTHTRIGLPLAFASASASSHVRWKVMRHGFCQSSAVGAGQVVSRLACIVAGPPGVPPRGSPCAASGAPSAAKQTRTAGGRRERIRSIGENAERSGGSPYRGCERSTRRDGHGGLHEGGDQGPVRVPAAPSDETAVAEVMRTRPSSAFVACLLAALSACSSLSKEPPAKESVAVDTIAPGENLVTEGIPPIPRSLADAVGRYGEFREASFAGWHPTKRELLVVTRFG